MRHGWIFLLAGVLSTTSLYAAKQSQSSPFSIDYSNHGLLISNTDGSFQSNLRGYIQFDAIHAKQNFMDFDSGTNVRRARLNLVGKILSDWGYSLGYELRDNNITNAYGSYNGFKNMYIQVGQFLPDVSFSNWLNNTDIDFVELPMAVNTFVPDYSQGIGYGINNQYLSFNVSGYTTRTRTTVVRRTPLGAAGRLIYSPFHDAKQALDLGVSAWYYRPDSNKQVSYSSIPEVTDSRSDAIINTQTINHVSYTKAGDLEAFYNHGPWSLQGEYVIQGVNRYARSRNLQFNGYYIAGTYFITGESLVYVFPDGMYSGITPIRNKKWGAWEAAAQWSQLDLNSEEVRGGKAHNFTLGVTWYPNLYFRFKLDYVRAMARPASNGQNLNDNIVVLRSQVQF